MTFKTGRSGNVNGRPKGTGCRQQVFKSLVEPHMDALFAKGVGLALAGNEAMLRLFLERMMPSKYNNDAIRFCMPNTKGKKVSQIIADILDSLSGKEITIAELKHIMRIAIDRCELSQENNKHIEEMQEMIKKYRRDY